MFSRAVRIMVLTLGVCLGTITGGVAMAASPSQYQASSAVLVDIAQVEDAEQVTHLSSYTRQQINNYANLAKTPMVLDSVVNDLGMDIAPQELSAQVSTSVPMDSTTVDITATGDSPEQAAQMADAVAQSLVDSIDEVAPTTATGDPLVRGIQVTTALEPNSPSSPGALLGALVGAGLGLVIALLVLLLASAMTRGKREERRREGL